jgi:serine/threonine protein kinase
MLRQNTKTAVLIDFGLAREFVSGKTQTHTSAVTESFAPIEQYERRTKRGAYTDVYALAATYYYLVTRQLPFPSHYRQQGIKLIPPQKHNPQISDRVNQMILEGMALEPYQRPQSIKEWLELLQPNQALSSPPPPQAKPQIQPPQPSVSSPQASSNRVISQPSPATPNNYSSGGKLYQLRDLLAANQWQQADFLTYQIMLKIAAREDKGWLDKESIQKFPCEYLSIIDQLWLKYSQKRFGFSIQQKIWQQGRSKISYLAECHLGDRVGWRVNGQWLDYKNLSFQQNAPIGHLPTCSLGRWVWSWTWSGQCSAFFFLIESCQL